MTLELYTLGGLSSRTGGGGAPEALGHTKKNALLAYLAAEPVPGAHARDTLLALFWPESDDRRARDALKQLVRSLRRDLDDAVVSGRGGLALGEGRVWCDALAVERAAEAEDLEAVLDLYRGEFLAGFHLSNAPDFERWIDRRRRQLRDTAVGAVRRLAEERAATGDVDGSADARHWVLHHDPYDEGSLRSLMRHYLDGGEPGRAIALFEDFVARLEQDLDAGPADETLALARRARARPRGGGNSRTESEPDSRTATLPASIAGGMEASIASPLPPAHRRPRWWSAGVIGLAATVVIAAFLSGWFDRGQRPSRLAILPFESLGPADSAYFARGLSDDLIVSLSRLPELEIVSAADRGRGLPPPTPTAAATELEADYALTGSVRFSRTEDGRARVRVVPRLVRAVDNTQMWSETFEVFVDDFFDVQSGIALAVSEALGRELVGVEEVATPPTADVEAYAFYLRGRDFLRREWVRVNLRLAEDMFREAVRRDPGFAEAWAGLSLASSELHHGRWDRSPEVRLRAIQAADSATVLAPTGAESMFATAMVDYRIHERFESAARLMDLVEAERPTDTDVLMARGYLERRRGAWQLAVRYQTRALEIEPQVARGRGGLVWTLIPLRRYEEADRVISESLEMFPDMRGFYGTAALVKLIGWGDVRSARDLLETGNRRVGYAPIGPTWFTLELLDREYEAALATIQGRGGGAHLDRALVYGLMGDETRARVYADSARQSLEAARERSPESPGTRGLLGLAYAHLGRGDEAVYEVQEAMELLPVDRDAVAGPEHVERLAQVHAILGDADAAVEVLRYLLSIPSEVSLARLRVDPRYDRVRDSEPFREMMGEGGPTS